MRGFMEAVRSRVVVFDGGMGATLEQFDLSSEDYGGLPGKCHEALVLQRPDVIQGVHESMLDAGAEVVETDTFQASRIKLDEWGLGEHTREINVRAAQIARKAVGEDRFVAGSIGPTGHLPASDDPTLGAITFRELVDVFTEQAAGLVESGADLIIIETAQDILEGKAAVFGARAALTLHGRSVAAQASLRLPRAAPAARQLHDRGRAARPGAAPDARRRARELAGLAQGQGDAAGRRLRRPRPGRGGPGRGRRARARCLRRAHRARRRGRA